MNCLVRIFDRKSMKNQHKYEYKENLIMFEDFSTSILKLF